MKIIELFASIQGESTLQGFPTVFVRTAGCNLDCSWCDTPYAREGGTDMTVAEIVAAVRLYALRYVCITGGEPLLQEDTTLLAAELLSGGHTVSVETNGACDASPLPRGVKRIIDIKCPSSGEAGHTHPANLADIRPTDEFKFVLADRADFDYARTFVADHPRLAAAAILLSPVSGVLDSAELAAWMLRETPEYRLHLQLHPAIWPGKTRGR